MKSNDVVPDFELPDQDGTPRTLTGLLAGGPVALFFYPMAMTTGCTRESCHFRDLATEFAEVHGFDYPLLSDVDGTVARLFGVKRRFGPVPVKRTTFVIDTGRRVLGVIASELNMDKHADEAL